MSAQDASTGPARAQTPRDSGISWGVISKKLSEGIHREVVSRFKEHGGDFGRWSRIDWERLCDAMTAAEDWLESEHPGRQRDRAALRAARRQLEKELWP
jgi:hypothetical protein